MKIILLAAFGIVCLFFKSYMEGIREEKPNLFGFLLVLFCSRIVFFIYMAAREW